MTTTTVGDLLARAEALTTDLASDPGPVTRRSWRDFDMTTYRLLDTITTLPPPEATNRPGPLTRLRDWDRTSFRGDDGIWA